MCVGGWRRESDWGVRPGSGRNPGGSAFLSVTRLSLGRGCRDREVTVTILSTCILAVDSALVDDVARQSQALRNSLNKGTLQDQIHRCAHECYSKLRGINGGNR